MDIEGERGRFGSVLRRLRLAAGLSQEELAERARLSVEGISALERGRRRAPYRETIRMLGDALQLSEPERRELEGAAKRPRASNAAGHATGDRARQNLPLQRTSLIGRESEVANIVRIPNDSRLVTLTGAGGIGKTRTALAAGNALLGSTKSEVWLVELAALGRGSLVASAVAHALNVRESPTAPLRETLVAHLEQKELLLILDNCEHVVTGAAVLADALLGRCPFLRILATSREALRISGELIYRLPSLPVPTASETLEIGAVAAARYDAIVLFTQRARAIDRAFTLSDENAPSVAEICRRLDGIPLAIELAAARVDTLPVQAISSKLDQRFQILTHGERTALPRFRTMRALLDWSFDLLAPPEQRLFERLSIFAGGCDLAEAAAVYGEGADEFGMLELLSSLVEKSLLVADLDRREPRYRLLESSRQYACGKLEARGEATLVARRHAAAYVELAERLERERGTASDWECARAELEVENWRAALDWALGARGDVVLGQRLAAATYLVWTDVSLPEGRRWLEAARALVDERTPAAVKTHLDFAALGIAVALGEWEGALIESRRLQEVYLAARDLLGVAHVRLFAGVSLVCLGRASEAEPLLQSALEAGRSLGNPRLAGTALENIAFARSSAGDLSQARARIAEAVEIWRALGAERNAAEAAVILAEAEFHAGNTERALELVTASLDTLRALRASRVLAPTLLNLSAYQIACNRWLEARAAAREALGLARDTQRNVWPVWALQHLAAIAALSASGTDRESCAIAAQLLGFVDARIAGLHSLREFTEQQEYDRALSVLRDRVDPGELAHLMAGGATLTHAQAVKCALTI